jgi:hypothetical protein
MKSTVKSISTGFIKRRKLTKWEARKYVLTKQDQVRRNRKGKSSF